MLQRALTLVDVLYRHGASYVHAEGSREFVEGVAWAWRLQLRLGLTVPSHSNGPFNRSQDLIDGPRSYAIFLV